MKTAERIVMVLLLLFIVGAGAWIYFAVQASQQEVRDAVARGEYEISNDIEPEEIQAEEWRLIYPATVPVVIGSTTVQASVADNLPERIKGLSDTPFLPENVVKLFAFEGEGEHAIWMKNMNYSLDVMWLSKDGIIVHIEENLSPDSYPQSFGSPVKVWFVIEANAGFVENNHLKTGDKVVLP